jgi:predicted extracellular nuclease
MQGRLRPVRSSGSFACSLAICALAAAVLVTGGRRLLAAMPFTPGDLVVYRVGDGSGSLLSTGNAVFLDEFAPGGTLVQSIPLPTAAAGSNRRLIASGTATSEGLLTRSTDGLYVLLTGYDAAIPTAGLAGTSGTTVARVVGRVDVAGNVDTTTGLSDLASGNNPRGAASSNGFDLWVSGGAGGVRYATLGASTSTQLSTTVTNIRAVEIFDGQLYSSDSSGTAVRLGTVGAGLPTTSGQSIVNLPGIPSSAGSPYAFFFADLDGLVPGVDTLYVADDGAGIQKYSLVSATWTLNGTVGTSSETYRSLTGVVQGASVTLYATRKGGGGAAGGGELVALTDSSGHNGSFAALPILLATAAPNTAFRGVALAPTGIAITTPPADQTVGSGDTATLSVVAAGQAPLAYQWYIGSSGDTSNPIGDATNPTFTTAALTATTTYWVRVSNAFGHADSRTATVTVQTVAPPSISVQPASQTVPAGSTATLSVIATGDGLTYQWYPGASGDTTNPIGGANAVSFTTPALFATASYWVRVSNAGGSADSQTAIVTVNAVACSAPHTPINMVQGAGETSPQAGQTVSVRGVVVGDYEGATPALRGFYLQSLPEDDDHNPTTSEGVFVFEGSGADAVSIGQVVQATGSVEEFQGQTEVNASTVESCGTTATVTPVDVTLPVPAAQNGVAYLEQFESMLVRFHQTLYVTEHFQLGRFGQIVMSSGGRLPQPTSIAAPGAPALSQQSANDQNRIIVDDELNNQNPDPIRFGRAGAPLNAANTLRGGDTATDIVGVITYTWAGNAASGNAYRLRPVNALGGGVPPFQPSSPRPISPPAVGGTLKVVGMNVLNYFLTLDNGQSVCGPIGNKQECRGAETVAERTRQQDKLNQALVKLNADIIGLSELENSQNAQGLDVNPLADIVGRLNATVGPDTYSYVDTGVIGTDTIRVGLIYKPERVTAVGPPMIDGNPVHNRPPVAQFFADTATGERFTVVANHFKSKGCADNPANPLDNNQGDGEGCFNATRVQQANALAAFVQQTVVPAVGDPDILLVGDFNSYAKEDPIRALEQAGFTNLILRSIGAGAYSYVFDGQWGYLDHALASGSLLPQVTGAADYHINADEPSVLDYNTNFKSPGQVVSLYNADEFRIADHDPVIVGLAPRAAPHATADSYTVEAGSTLAVDAAHGVLANDAGGPLAIFSYTNPSHGTLTVNPDGSFSYRPEAGFTGNDTFTYTISGSTPSYSVTLHTTNVPPLATIGGVVLSGGAFGSALTPVPGSSDEFYGLTDRGPNVDGPNGTKVEPLPAFTPSIGKFRLTGGEAQLEQVIPLKAADGTPFSGRVSTLANTGEVITDLNGNVLPPDANGYDSEGLVALPDGTFWVSDEYGPFIAHFDATGREIARLSPFDGSLPAELAKRIPNRGMEGLTITPDGTTLVGMMQSALQQDDLNGFDSKKLTPLRIVTYRLADGATHEYLYLLDNPVSTKTAVSEITALSNTVFLVEERDGNVQPAAYKKIFLIDVAGATDVGPSSAVPGTAYDPARGGLLVNGKTIELLLQNQDTAASTVTLTANGIAVVSKRLFVDLSALVTSVDARGRFFGHDKVEGVAAINGGATLVISNDSDFGIDGLATSTPPFQLHAKITPAGTQDDGELLVVDLVRSTATVTINVADTIAPETTLTSTPPTLTKETTAAFAFTGSDGGSGVAGFECALDGNAFTACDGSASYSGLGDGGHTFAARAFDHAGNVDATPAEYAWIVDTAAPLFAVPADQMLEATGPAGAVATFVLPTQAADAIDGIVPVQCVGGISGAIFPIGATTIECSASDRAGNSASHAFIIVVADTTPPTIDPHGNVTANAPPGSNSAVVTYDAPATHDLVDGLGAASCTPASGSTFQVGTTPVICGAVDHAGNHAVPVTFNVIVVAAGSGIDRFTVFSRTLTWLGAGATVTTGDVGANEHGSGTNGITMIVGPGAKLEQPSSRVVGDTVLLMNQSSVFDVVHNLLIDGGTTIRGSQITPMTVPFTTLPAFPAVAPGTVGITVPASKVTILPPGRYGAVHVSAGGLLYLTGGLYQLLSLQVDQAALVVFHAATEMRIERGLAAASQAKLVLDPSVAALRPSQVVIYVKGADENPSVAELDDNSADATASGIAASFGVGSIVQANVYAANGTVWLLAGSQAAGAFIGDHVRIGIGARVALDSAFK